MRCPGCNDCCRRRYGMLLCEYCCARHHVPSRHLSSNLETGRTSVSPRANNTGPGIMSDSDNPSSPRDKPLFTPGPLTTSRTVKQAMLRDVGSRDDEFIDIVRHIRERLLAITGLSQQAGYECVLMQGSGTYTVESVISSVIPRDGKLLVIINGAYGERIVSIAKRYGIETVVVRTGENKLPDISEIERTLAGTSNIRMTAVVHCETTSG